MYPMEVSSGVSSSKNIMPMFSKNPRHWLIRFVIGCGQFWLLPRTAEEKNDLDAQRNQAGGAFRFCARHKQQSYCFQSAWLESRVGRLDPVYLSSEHREMMGFVRDVVADAALFRATHQRCARVGW